MDWVLCRHVFFISLSGFLLGYDLCFIGSILGPVQRSLELCFPCPGGTAVASLATCNCAEKQFAVSSVSIGAVVGGLFGGWLGDAAGRRKTLLVTDLLFGIGAVAMAIAGPRSAWLFYTGRALSGVALGAGGTASSAYLAEISPANIRGAVVEANELMVCVGCLSAYVAAASFGDALWRCTVGMALVPVALQVLGVAALLRESPRWLASQGHHRLAQEAAADLSLEGVFDRHGAVDEGCIAAAEAGNGHTPANGARRERPSAAAALWSHRKAVLIALGCALAHNATAGNTVLYYSRNVLQRAGIHHALLVNVLVGVTKLGGVCVAVALVDRLGRRRMLLVGNAGVIVSHVGLAAAFAQNPKHPADKLALGSMLLFILGWDISWAGLMLVVASELLPQDVRAHGLGIVYSTYHLVSFLQEQTLQTLFETFTVAGTFAFYGILSYVGEFFIWRCVPETGGCSLEGIEGETGIEEEPSEEGSSKSSGKSPDSLCACSEEENSEPVAS